MVPSDQAVPTITGFLAEVQANPDEIAAVQQALNTIMSTLNEDNFQYLATIQKESFGDDTHATGLAFHHGLAQQVMNETLDGIKKDIEAFAQNLKKAHEMLNEVDDAANADLTKRQALVSAFSHLSRHSSEAGAHNRARNHQHDPWATPNSGSQDAGSAPAE